MVSRSRGFTLVELLVVMAIAGVLFAALLNSLIVSTRVHDRQSARDRVQADVESVALSLATDLGRAGFLSDDPTAVTWLAQNWSATSYPTIRVASGAPYDDLTVRWGAEGADCPSGAEASYAVDGQTICIRSVRYYVSDGRLYRDLDEADPVEVLPYTVEDFQVFYKDRNGTWSSTLPAPASLAAVGVYLRVAAPYEGEAGCGTYPSSEVLAAYGSASALGIPQVTYSTCDGVLRLERVVGVGLANLQRY
ncbi:type II secretion system protein [Oceanithermus sp.]